MTLIYLLDVFFATTLTVAIGIFALRYGYRAPWYRTFEGRVIFLTYTSFFFTMLNLVIFLFTGWGGYRYGMFVTMAASTVLVIYQNVVLTRAREAARAKEQQP